MILPKSSSFRQLELLAEVWVWSDLQEGVTHGSCIAMPVPAVASAQKSCISGALWQPGYHALLAIVVVHRHPSLVRLFTAPPSESLLPKSLKWSEILKWQRPLKRHTGLDSWIRKCRPFWSLRQKLLWCPHFFTLAVIRHREKARNL